MRVSIFFGVRNFPSLTCASKREITDTYFTFHFHEHDCAIIAEKTENSLRAWDRLMGFMNLAHLNENPSAAWNNDTPSSIPSCQKRAMTENGKWNGETKPFSSEQFGNFITSAHQKGRGYVTVFEERKKEHGCAACHYSSTRREFMLVRWIIWIKTVLTPHTSRFPEVLTPFEISRMDHFSSHDTMHWRKNNCM